MATRFRIAFAGTPDFAVPALDALHRSPHEIVGVWTQPDRPAGRGRKLTAPAVKQYALHHSLAVYQAHSFRDPQARQELAVMEPDVMVVVAYGLILPAEVLAIPTYGCLNIHASLLPRWRGAAPIQRALMAGDTLTGVSIMQMNAGLDTGDVLLQRQTPIQPDDTGGSLHDRLSLLGAEAIVEVLQMLANGELVSRPQSDTGASYAAKLDKREAWLDWSLSAEQLGRQVRAFDPWPVACTGLQGNRLRIWEAWPLPSATHGSRHRPGTVLSANRDGIVVQTGKGLLRIVSLQLSGRRRMSAAEFANSHQLESVVLTTPPEAVP